MLTNYSQFKELHVVVVGGGIGGLAAAIALRRAGHRVCIYERRNSNLEVGASISCAANGSQWLKEWGVDISQMRPVTLDNLIMREWETGKVLSNYSFEDYEKQWGHVYHMFHRQDMHRVLLNTATSKEGIGHPCEVHINHICDYIDFRKGIVTFKNGVTVRADLIIGADGIRSRVRAQLGIIPHIKSSPQTCYRCNIPTDVVKKLGLVDYAYEPAIQFWGGLEGSNGRSKYYKVVMAPCMGGSMVSFYCFMPTELTNHHEEGFSFEEVPVSDILKGRYSNLDPDCIALLKNSIERMPWRLYVHKPYPFWQQGLACIMGDAAHPMMPHQSQGACQALEDAAALGIIFSRSYPQYTTDVATGLRIFDQIRKPRATRVQEASAWATDDILERIGFSTLHSKEHSVARDKSKLTVNEMNEYDMRAHIAKAVRAETLPYMSRL